jgi:hypothetical protein
MRDLIDILTEAMAPHLVYHSTEFGEEILASGVIKANSTIDPVAKASKASDLRFDTEHHAIRGVCVTRSFRFARLFSNVIFGLDVEALRHRFKMIPRAEVGAYDAADDHGDFRLEAEEFIVVPGSGLDLDRYLVSIWVMDEYRDDPDYAEIIADERFVDFYNQA